MSAYLVNHLRQPGVLNPDVLDYLDQVQATLDPFGGKFIVQGSEVEVLEGAWAGSVILLSFPDALRLALGTNRPPIKKFFTSGLITSLATSFSLAASVQTVDRGNSHSRSGKNSD